MPALLAALGLGAFAEIVAGILSVLAAIRGIYLVWWFIKKVR
ncbi:hypothetical protein [Xanthomonas citri]|nr:hypothetical protein [Xanthomonas citri]